MDVTSDLASRNAAATAKMANDVVNLNKITKTVYTGNGQKRNNKKKSTILSTIGLTLLMFFSSFGLCEAANCG